MLKQQVASDNVDREAGTVIAPVNIESGEQGGREKDADLTNKSIVVAKEDDSDLYLNLCGITRVQKKWLVLVLLVVQGTSMVLVTRYSRTSGDPTKRYLSSTAIVLAEMIKTVTAFCVVMANASRESFSQVLTGVRAELWHMDTFKMAVPGLLYLVQSYLLFLALSNLDAAVYQVTYQLKILTTAFFSVVMLGRSLGKVQIGSLLLLTCGVALVQYGEFLSASGNGPARTTEGNPVLGLICVLCACFSSGFAGVYLEKVFKNGRKVSIWIRNIQLGLFGTLFGFFGIFVSPAERQIVFEDGFFRGYDYIVWSVVLNQALGGLIIAAVIQYSDNIMKGFATSLSIVLSSMASFWLFTATSFTEQFLIGALLVIVAVMLFGLPSNPSPPTPQYAPVPAEETHRKS